MPLRSKSWLWSRLGRLWSRRVAADRRPSEPSTFFETLCALASRDDCFEQLDEILKAQRDLRPDFYKWAALLELDDLQSWLLRDRGWSGSAFRRNHPGAIRLVQEILRRRLKDLGTRRDPSQLVDLWEWVFESPDVSDSVRSIWDGRGDQLKKTLVSPIVRPIPKQEEAFATLLREVATELTRELTRSDVKLDKLRWAIDLKWAIDILKDLARERHPEAIPVDGASVRVVFAWDSDSEEGPGSAPQFFRSGILVTFDFDRKPVWWPLDRIDWFKPKGRFDPEFIAEMGLLMKERGDCFPMSAVQVELPPLPPLKGSSGKLAVGTAQALANPKVRGDDAHALPPWVAVTATSGPVRGGDAEPVGFFEQKMRALIQEGVRVVISADAQKDAVAPDGFEEVVEVIPHGGGYASAADAIRRAGYTWTADLGALKPGLTRRQMFFTAATLAGIGMAGGLIGWITAQKPAESTPAIERSRDRKSELLSLREACKREAVGLEESLPVSPTNGVLARLEVLCRQACPRDDLPDPKISVLAYAAKPPETVKPKEADFTSDDAEVELLAKHVAFDCSEWEGLSSEKDIPRIPTEAAFHTAVYRFRRKKEGVLHVGLEHNSSGFGVVPLLEPGDELRLGVKTMLDAPGKFMKTSYVIRTIPEEWPHVFEVAVHSIYFNSFQDQQARGGKTDWCAIRVHPGAQDASLALADPKRRAIRSAGRTRTEENGKEEDLGPPDLSKLHFENMTYQYWHVFKIDTEEVRVPTVFGIRWKWKRP